MTSTRRVFLKALGFVGIASQVPVPRPKPIETWTFQTPYMNYGVPQGIRCEAVRSIGGKPTWLWLPQHNDEERRKVLEAFERGEF